MNTTVQEWKKVKDLEVGMKIAVPRSGVFGMFSKTYENMAGPENEMAETGQEDVLWDEIVSIESVGVEQVFDIEVEGTHNFVAGHLIDSETGVQLEEKEEKEVLAGNDKNRKTWYGGIYAHNTYINGNVGIGTSVANTALEIGGSGNVRIGGLTISSGVYTDASKTLTSTPPTTGVIGYWSRTGTTLSPSVAGDDLVLPTGDWIGLSFTTARLVFNDTARDNLTITDGDLLFSADSAWNIGAIGATRPGNIYVGTSVVVGGTTTLTTDTLTGSGALNFTSQLALGQGTASAFNLTSSNDLGAADELIQIGDSAGTFLTVLGNGNVGIGTTGPDAALHIIKAGQGLHVNAGGANGTNQILLENSSQTATKYNMALDYNGSYVFLGMGVNGSAYSMAMQSNGNVGIGTTNPTNKFSVYASSIPNYSSDQASGGTAIGGTDQLGKEKAKAFDNDSTTSWVASSGGPDWIGYDFGAGVSKTITRYTVQARYDDYLNFSMGDFTLQGSNTGAWGGEQVTLDTRAGIDWTSATQVQTFTLSNSTAYRYYRIYVTAPSSPGSWNVGAGEVEFMETSSYSSGSALEVTNLGNVGIGTTAPVYTLDVGGGSAGYDIRGYDVYTHDGAVTSFSDQRLKSIQGNFDRGLNEILALNPQYYHYKSSNSLGLASSETVVGLMAQDVQKLIPEAVQMSSSGYLTMSQGPIFYAMINAVKEQQGLIVEQQAKNTQQDTAIAGVNLKTSQNVETVQQLQNSVDQNLVVISNNLTTLSAGEAGLNSSVASLSAKQAAYDAQAADVESRLAAAEQKFKDDENNLATFETATNDTLSTMLQTENMLTERVLNHEERIKALEDKLATMTVSGNGEIPANVITQDASGNATLAGVFKAKEVQTDGVVAGTMTIKNDKTSDAPTMGDGEIISVKVDADKDGWDDVTKVDGKSARVKTDAISETAKIFVTFEGDPGSRYWVEKIKDADGKLTNSFSINVSDPVKKDVKFSWWIVESK